MLFPSGAPRIVIAASDQRATPAPTVSYKLDSLESPFLQHKRLKPCPLLIWLRDSRYGSTRAGGRQSRFEQRITTEPCIGRALRDYNVLPEPRSAIKKETDRILKESAQQWYRRHQRASRRRSTSHSQPPLLIVDSHRKPADFRYTTKSGVRLASASRSSQVAGGSRDPDRPLVAVRRRRC